MAPPSNAELELIVGTGVGVGRGVAVGLGLGVAVGVNVGIGLGVAVGCVIVGCIVADGWRLVLVMPDVFAVDAFDFGSDTAHTQHQGE